MRGARGRPKPSAAAPLRTHHVLESGSTIGILGGGQLGRMLALAAARLGLRCHVFAPSPDSCAFDVVHRVTCADYADTGALDWTARNELAKKWVVTAGAPLADLDVADACARRLAA